MSDNKTIMVIDDSKVSRMMIIAILKDKHPELTFLEASSGDEAIALSDGKSIDFFSVDYNMPGMDGLKLIAQLKDSFTDSKFTLLTANIQDATHQKAQKVGAICLNKPINEACIDGMLEYFYG